MRGFAGKDHPVVDELRHAPALEFVDRDPLEVEIAVAEHPRDPRPDIFGQPLDGRVGIAAELQVDAPDIVRLLVEQRRAAGMERRIEPEPAFGGERGGHPDVGDQKLVLEHLAGEVGADHAAQRRARPVARHHIGRTEAIFGPRASRCPTRYDRCAPRAP